MVVHCPIPSLIWNLLLTGRTSIEHVLRSHYRAITDINWHTIEPNVVISTGIDSWQWAWDLRIVQKPIMGMHPDPRGMPSYINFSAHQGSVLLVVCLLFLSCATSLTQCITNLAPGTQVKWNRVDGNILASSHLNEVLIWDRRVCSALSCAVSTLKRDF